MKCIASILFLLCFAVPAGATDVIVGAQVGAVGGVGGDVYLEVADFAEGLPLDLRLGVEYQSRSAGDPVAARRVFINDATNGTPSGSGRAWGARMDLLYPLGFVQDVLVFAGPRWASAMSTFDYVGGNENFDVVSTHWGWGGGLEGRYPISASADFVLGGGVDWYLGSSLDGHDTIYSPDLDPVNGRDGYDYTDANDAVNQPSLEWRLQLGVQFALGR